MDVNHEVVAVCVARINHVVEHYRGHVLVVYLVHMHLSLRQPFSNVVQIKGLELLVELISVGEVNPLLVLVGDCSEMVNPLILRVRLVLLQDAEPLDVHADFNGVKVMEGESDVDYDDNVNYVILLDHVSYYVVTRVVNHSSVTLREPLGKRPLGVMLLVEKVTLVFISEPPVENRN